MKWRNRRKNMFVVWKPLRLLMVATFILLVLTSAGPSNGQVGDRRLDEALAEIALLKRVVAEQNRRITQLEDTVKKFQAGSGRQGTVQQPQSVAQQSESAP